MESSSLVVKILPQRGQIQIRLWLGVIVTITPTILNERPGHSLKIRPLQTVLQQQAERSEHVKLHGGGR